MRRLGLGSTCDIEFFRTFAITVLRIQNWATVVAPFLLAACQSSGSASSAAVADPLQKRAASKHQQIYSIRTNHSYQPSLLAVAILSAGTLSNLVSNWSTQASSKAGEKRFQLSVFIKSNLLLPALNLAKSFQLGQSSKHHVLHSCLLAVKCQAGAAI